VPIRLLLADDHRIVLDGLERLFQQQKDFAVVGACNRGAEVVPAVLQLRPDILVLDIRMPDQDGFSVLRQLKVHPHDTRTIILAASLTEKELLEGIRLGVRGVVLKEMAPHLLVECIRKVHAGERWFEESMAGSALEGLARREDAQRELSGILTAREVEVARLIAAGLQNKEIAGRLFISEGTVKIHLHHIYEKLKVTGRLELSLFARDRGLG
jgi:DNA-binding NarL/FixJ family response regulator